MKRNGKKVWAVILAAVLTIQLCCPAALAEELVSGQDRTEAATISSGFVEDTADIAEDVSDITEDTPDTEEAILLQEKAQEPVQTEEIAGDMSQAEIMPEETVPEDTQSSEESDVLDSGSGEDPFGDSFISENEEESGIVQLDQEKVVNPLYEGLVDPSELLDVQDSGIQTYAEIEYATTAEPLAETVREGMKNRLSLIPLNFRLDTTDASAWKTYLKSDILSLAFAHTGVPDEGDYIRWGYKGYSVSTSYFQKDGYYYYQAKITFTYYTTEEQETELGEAVSLALQGMNLSGQTDYVKIKRIYDYICSHVTYDYDTLNDSSYTLKYTAYAAMINGTAVCQGYAALLYRMALSVGVDARLIPGNANAQRHGWNIAKVENRYYNLDSTWDSSRTSYAYFLKSDSDFPNHTRDSEYADDVFYANYPMSEENYDDHEKKVLLEEEAATCTQNGLTAEYGCVNCDAIIESQMMIPALGHAEEVTKEGKAATCTESGLTDGITCSRCDEILQEQEEVSALGHDWSGWEVTKATLTEDGERIRVCARDENHTEVQTIYHPTTFTLSATSYQYSGTVQRPTVKSVKDSRGNVISSSNYTVSYSSGCKNAGTYTVSIKFQGNYSGTKKLTYKIVKASQTITASGKTKILGNPLFSLGAKCTSGGTLTYKSDAPLVAAVSSKGNVLVKSVGTATITITAASTANYNSAVKKITIKVLPTGTMVFGLANTAASRLSVAWKRNAAADGYQIQYAMKNTFSDARTVTIWSNARVLTYIQNLVKGKGYYVRIRTFKKAGGKYYYSTWSSYKGIVIRY